MSATAPTTIRCDRSRRLSPRRRDESEIYGLVFRPRPKRSKTKARLYLAIDLVTHRSDQAVLTLFAKEVTDAWYAAPESRAKAVRE